MRGKPVHPHACGDNRRIVACAWSCRFTPTPVGTIAYWYWPIHLHRFTPTPVGTIAPFENHSVAPRFTPTPVGNLPISCGIEQTKTVHPHACGDNDVCEPQQSAYRLSVHPHACGDNKTLAQSGSSFAAGSPPRLWGHIAPSAARFKRPPVHPHACGDKRLSVARFALLPVHPHACGDICTFGFLATVARSVHPHACGDNARSAPSA